MLTTIEDVDAVLRIGGNAGNIDSAQRAQPRFPTPAPLYTENGRRLPLSTVVNQSCLFFFCYHRPRQVRSGTSS